MNKHFRFSGSTFHKLEEPGVRASAVLRRAGLAQGLIDEPRVLLATKELFALWRAVGEVSTNPAIGLLLGTENKTERFHPIGLVALSTENFSSAIEQWLAWLPRITPWQGRRQNLVASKEGGS